MTTTSSEAPHEKAPREETPRAEAPHDEAPHDEAPREEAPREGLRERKKRRTRETIRREAFRLIRAQGYEATTVDQIAEAAEVSPSTFFRYFPTKEDAVLDDGYDPLLLAGVAAIPAEVTPISAIRQGMTRALGDLPPEVFTEMREQITLFESVPALRARFGEQAIAQAEVFAALLAERSGRPPTDLLVRAAAAAVTAALSTAAVSWAEHPDTELVATIDEVLTAFEAGFPL